ncbi:MAG: glycosyltransferase family 4 protein [Bacteroidales bacterium]|nr:glycosyltransferase family 4 protein [Bacteroidales bacterium]
MKKKILYVTSRDPKDKRTWSGTMYYMAKSLEKHAGEVIYGGPYNPFFFFIQKFIKRITLWTTGKNYLSSYSTVLSYLYKWHFEKLVKKHAPDVIFAGSASVEVSRLNVGCPIINLNDITFELLIDRYNHFTNLTTRSLKRGESIEQLSFNNSKALIFSSQWAADSAHKHYKIPKENIHIISFGANTDRIPLRDEVFNKKYNKINILFLGVEWIRKGGNIVYDTFVELQKRNLEKEIHLTFLGLTPPVESIASNITIIPFLNKNKTEDFNAFYDLMLQSHILFVPSRFDCTPIAFCEASAFGLPIISTNVGGISSVVKDGSNGFLLPVEAGAKEYADLISNIISKENMLQNLTLSTRDYYESNLSWDQWGEKLSELVNKLS